MGQEATLLGSTTLQFRGDRESGWRVGGGVWLSDMDGCVQGHSLRWAFTVGLCATWSPRASLELGAWGTGPPCTSSLHPS